MNHYKFPYDTQTCHISVGFWQQDSSRINFASKYSEIDYANIIENKIWTLKSVHISEVISKRRFALNMSAVDVTFSFVLTRRPMNFMLSDIFPTLIISAVTLVSFFFPYGQQCAVSKLNFFFILLSFSRLITFDSFVQFRKTFFVM